ncbi:MAG: hypothetical protein AAF915_30730 [Cyanobacteria bacterium P01_D01_bin.50]
MMQFQHQQQNPNYQNNQHTTDDFDESWVPNPHGQVRTSAETPGLINLIGSKNLDSLLMNPWLMSIFVATLILVVIAAIATTLSSQSSSKQNPEQEAYERAFTKVSEFGSSPQ